MGILTSTRKASVHTRVATAPRALTSCPTSTASLNTRALHEALTIVHNETSTGLTNPVGPILAAVRAASPDTLTCVDTVSSIAGMPVKMDEWGADFVLFGVQKCLALPPGMAIAAVTERAMAKAAQVEGRGWFMDLLNLKKYNQKEHSPGTPSTAHLYAMVKQLERIFTEG